MTKAAVSKWKQGNINVNWLKDFAKKYNVSFIWLITGDTNNNNIMKYQFKIR
jgi:hypothetical protein